MIKNRDIIVIGIQPWDIEIGSNCKNIALEFARHNRVLYVNAPLDRITRYKEKETPKIRKRILVEQGKEPDLVKLDNNLWNLYPRGLTESINWISSPSLYDFFNKRNCRIFAKAILSAIKRLEFSRYILFNDSSMFLGLHMKELLKPAVYVYYMRDYLTKNPYWRRQGVRLEPQLIRKADVVVNNSTLYADYGRQFNNHSYMVGQGCDVSLFNDIDREIKPAADLASIPSPIIGYVGFLSSRRLDINLLINIARNKPEWSIVLVGPEDDAFKSSELHGMPNVKFPGSRDSSVLPEYIKGFDVCINPQLINDATRGNYPRKIDEYLAMGKPTVATATEAMDYFRDYTYLGKSTDDYIKLIGQALREDSPEKQQQRRFYAKSHTWENNVEEIYKYIELVTNNQ
jgi:glycosyltransferase involved in cell wall biosynthesis